MTAVAATSTGLKGISLYTDDLTDGVQTFKPEEGHVFRVMSRKDEELHTLHFDVDEEGKAQRLWEHGQYMDRLR